MSLSGVQPALGAVPETWDVSVKVRGGNISAGRLYCFTLLQSSQITSDGDTISTEPGAPGYLYGSITATPSSADRRNGRYCIALESASDGDIAKVRLRGLVRAYVYDSVNGTINIGDELCPGVGTSTGLDTPTVTGGSTLRKIVGYAMEAGVSDGQVMTVDFDGWSGYGSANAT